MIPQLRWLVFGIFLGTSCLWVSMLCAEESLADVPTAVSVPSGTSEKTMGERTMPEGMTPGVGSAVAAAQQEVRDPFAMTESPLVLTPVEAGGGSSTVELIGVAFGSEGAYAVINDDVFIVGDEKNGIKLVEVRKGEADILDNGKLMTYLLFPDKDLKNSKERKERKREASASSADLKSENPSSVSRRGQMPS